MSEVANYPKTLQEAIKYFSNKQVCHDFIVSIRWKSSVTCPHCSSKEVGFVKTRFIYNCKKCRKQFSVRTGTVLQDSLLGLDKWIIGIWLVANCKNGISSCELARSIGITQKSAWFLLHRIRQIMATGNLEKLSGEVEADETYIGGKEANKHSSKKIREGRGAVGKVIVSGLLERNSKGSKIIAKTIPDIKTETIQNQVRNNVRPGSNLYTDALRSYNGLSDTYIHEIVDHTKEYVRGRISTNGLENFWCLLKRTIKGTYVAIDVPHLDRYLNEQTFRFNERKLNDGERLAVVLGQVAGNKLSYSKLIQKTLVFPAKGLPGSEAVAS